MGQPRTRIRYRRLTAAGASCAITLVALLGGAGLLPTDTTTRPVAQATLAAAVPAGGPVGTRARTVSPATVEPRDPAPASTGERFGSVEATRARLAAEALEVPPDSGEGRRVVFDQSAQRVWLVGRQGQVRRTYLVSGSAEDNLKPGTYEVYSRSKQAWGIDDGGTMRFMVRFTYGERAAIGFHDIPIKDGEHVQTRAELGEPLSSGCIRQWRPDAKALWEFAPLGTTVVVVA